MNADFSPEVRAQLMDDFFAEADEHLGNIRTQLGVLDGAADGGTPPPAALESLFRSAHSFKGISAMVGLTAAEELAHATEGFLRQLTRHEAVLSRPGLDLLAMVAQRLEQIVMARRLEQPIPASTDLIQSLERIAGTHTHRASGPSPPGAENSREPAARPAARQSAEARPGPALAPWQCTFAPSRELDARGININSIRARLAELGEIMSASPSVRADGTIAFEFVVGVREAPADLAAWERDGVLFRPLDPTEKVAESAEKTAPSPGLFIAPSHVVRVELSRLDELMRIVGEMVIHRSRLEERIGRCSGDTSALKGVSQALGLSLRDLRTAITRARLVPVAEIFSRMLFVVRDLARDTGKQVRLALEGEQTEIDKYLVERLKEPLLHLVRNAFSHGVESAAERIAQGKPAEATILLRAFAAGEFVMIHVRDDGRGIDLAAVTERAKALGIAVPENLDATGLLALLSAPGFSTREQADRSAGRGVGMGLVVDTIRELGGTVALESTMGGGTQFTLRLPLTLSIAETIIVSAAGQTCAVPQGCVDEIIQMPDSAVRTIKHAEVIPYRDGVLPIVRLGAMFGARAAAGSQLSILVLTSERGTTGLVVDRVHTQREVVIRPMRDPLLRVPGVTGATELGDGRPVLILDASAITSGAVRPHAPRPAAGSSLSRS